MVATENLNPRVVVTHEKFGGNLRDNKKTTETIHSTVVHSLPFFNEKN